MYVQRSRGFTLIELIITLIILGLLSIAVAPKFLGNESESAYAYRDRVLAVLRSVQLQAMHNTAATSCHKLYVNDKLIAGPSVDTCTGEPNSNNPDFLVVAIDSSSDIAFSAQDSNGAAFSEFNFDPFGRIDQNCLTSCRISVAVVAVCISNEGLIYACQ